MTPSSPDPTPDPRRQGIADMSDTATPRPDLIVKQFADGTRWEKAARDRTPDPRLSDAKRTLYEVMAQLRDAGYHDWPDLLQRDVLPALAQARSPADEQYRQRGAPRFTLTDLRAALASQPAPAPGLDVEALAESLFDETSDTYHAMTRVDALDIARRMVRGTRGKPLAARGSPDDPK